MFDRIRQLLSDGEAPHFAPDDPETAVAVLLVDAARMDGIFDRHERSTIRRLLERRFLLTDEATDELVALAEQTAPFPGELHPYTQRAVERMDPQRRTRLIEMLWEVTYADEKLTPQEDELLHRIAGLIDMSDTDREEAKHRVLRWLQQKHSR